MRYTIIGRNIEVTPGLRDAVQDKIGKLDRYFTPETEVNVTLSVQKERQNIEVTIPIKGTIIRAEESSSDMYVSIDLVEEIIERHLGVTYLAEFAAAICKDAGYQTIAGQIEVFARLSILAIGMPILKALLLAIRELGQ